MIKCTSHYNYFTFCHLWPIKGVEYFVREDKNRPTKRNVTSYRFLESWFE